VNIALFITCLADTLYPDTGKSIVKLLERLGHEVDFPREQVCCGQAHFNTGYRPEAMAMVRRNVDALAPYEYVVTPSASCAGMIRQHYPVLAEQYGDPELREKVTELSGRVYDLSELLADVLKLAELIVQLAGDRPSHILFPAVHKGRAEIRETFLTAMPAYGRPAPADLTDEPAALAEAARLHLREKFLRAKVAVSGANFAIAETGTIGVVESGGNGRMCLTLPETLITVMGIEKIVPRFEDLEVFLQLLPRSSTGERMNPYTSMWTGVHEGDGPRSFHLILLDNGRTDTLADTVGRQALACIRCSACLNVCPVYEHTGGHAYGSVYPGPIGAVLTPQLAGIEHTASLPFASTLCGACYDACPVKIDIPEVLIHLRAKVVEAKCSERKTPTAEALAMKASAKILASPKLLSASRRVARLGARALARDGAAGPLPGPGRAWSDVRDTPVPPSRSFRDWWNAR
jgi:L-lactate dehydrogenase complex protein LldF